MVSSSGTFMRKIYFFINTKKRIFSIEFFFLPFFPSPLPYIRRHVSMVSSCRQRDQPSCTVFMQPTPVLQACCHTPIYIYLYIGIYLLLSHSNIYLYIGISQSTIDSEGFKGGTRGAPIMPRDAVSRTANVDKPLRVDSALRYTCCHTPIQNINQHFQNR